MTPSAAITTAALKSTAPKISDCTWPAPSSWTQATTQRSHGIIARPTSTSASAKKTRIGSYWA